MFLRFRVIWGKKWTDTEDASLAMALMEWECVVERFDKAKIDAAIHHCKLTMAWPPSVCEFVEVCESLSGVPTVDEVMRLAIRRDFSHPMVAMVFEDVGGWAFSNDSEKILRKKIKDSFLKIKTNSRLKLLT